MPKSNAHHVTHKKSRSLESRGREENNLPAGISAASSMAEIRHTLVLLNEHEISVTARLDALVASQKNLSRELGRLDLLRAHIGSQAVSTRSISNNLLSNAASTASKLSDAVKQLDLEQARVKGTLDVVEQVAELKACVLGVAGSMGAPQDWETAAGYLSRASKIPKEIVKGPFAQEIVPTAEVPDLPDVSLDHAAESLRGLFLREFENAAREGNGTKVTRFFKLFPLIGRPDVGLEVYGRYVCQGVASRARANLNAGTGGDQRKEGFFYANALTKLFEHVAQIVEHHGGLVEQHYGTGSMVKVIERLQLEADIQGGIIIDTWSDERSIDRKLTEIRSYAFTFLVQSFLPAQPPRSGTPRAGSPASRNAVAEANARTEEGVDMKDVDGLLNEIAVMLGRWSLYSKFVAAKCKVYSSSIRRRRKLRLRHQEPRQPATAEVQGLQMPPLLNTSALSRKVTERLIIPFNTMTTFFFRRSVEKAFQLEEQPSELSLNPKKELTTQPPYISSTVDDVMYIVNQVIERSISASNRAIIASAVPSIARVLDSDFIGMIQRKMRDESYPKATIQGALPPERTIITFLVLINSLDVATEYVKRIVQPRIEEPPNIEPSKNAEGSSSNAMVHLFPFGYDAQFVKKTMKSLQHSFENKTSELVGDGIFVVFKNVIKPRLRPIIADSFRDIDYQMTAEELEQMNKDADAEEGDDQLVDLMVQRHFQRGWEALTKPLARIMTAASFEKLLATIISYLSEVIEKRVWSYYGRLNDLGAVRLERDIASIISIAVRGGKYGLRDVFARCTQICLVMNMEEDEWAELQIGPGGAGGDGILWDLDEEERNRARAMVRKS